MSMQTDQILLLCVLRWKIGQKSDALRVHKTHMDAGSMFCHSAVASRHAEKATFCRKAGILVASPSSPSSLEGGTRRRVFKAHAGR